MINGMRSTLSKMPEIADTKINERDEESEDEDEIIQKQNKVLLHLHSKMTDSDKKDTRFNKKGINQYLRDKFLDVSIKNENNSSVNHYKESTIKAFKCLQKPQELPEYLIEKNSSRKTLIREMINIKLNKEEVMKKKFLRLSNIELKHKLEEIKKEKQIQLQRLQYSE